MRGSLSACKTKPHLLFMEGHKLEGLWPSQAQRSAQTINNSFLQLGEREFMWRMGCNVIHANNAHLWHTLPVACLWSLINKAVMNWDGRGKCFFFFILHHLLCLPFIPSSSTSQARNHINNRMCHHLLFVLRTNRQRETLTGSCWSSIEMALSRILVRPSSWESTLISLCLGDFTSTLAVFMGDPNTGVAGSEVPDSPLDLFSESS